MKSLELENVEKIDNDDLPDLLVKILTVEEHFDSC
jgi:hypothetical protein